MSQRNVEILLGRLLTDEDFRESFFPVGVSSFERAAAQGLELTAVERTALSALRRRSVECLARALDARICRSRLPEAASADGAKWGF
jgi:hypothetical protein